MDEMKISMLIFSTFSSYLSYFSFINFAMWSTSSLSLPIISNNMTFMLAMYWKKWLNVTCLDPETLKLNHNFLLTKDQIFCFCSFRWSRQAVELIKHIRVLKTYQKLSHIFFAASNIRYVEFYLVWTSRHNNLFNSVFSILACSLNSLKLAGDCLTYFIALHCRQ